MQAIYITPSGPVVLDAEETTRRAPERAYIPTRLHTYTPTYLHAYIPTRLYTYTPTYLHAYIPTHL
jgi:hypothetical protein